MFRQLLNLSIRVPVNLNGWQSRWIQAWKSLAAKHRPLRARQWRHSVTRLSSCCASHRHDVQDVQDGGALSWVLVQGLAQPTDPIGWVAQEVQLTKLHMRRLWDQFKQIQLVAWCVYSSVDWGSNPIWTRSHHQALRLLRWLLGSQKFIRDAVVAWATIFSIFFSAKCDAKNAFSRTPSCTGIDRLVIAVRHTYGD